MHIRIAGFGLSAVAERTTTSGIDRDTGTAVTYYTAPELTEEGAKPDFPSDVWSFGCMCLLVSRCGQHMSGLQLISEVSTCQLRYSDNLLLSDLDRRTALCHV